MIIKGKAKDLLDDSIDNALLAVEIYNKPKLNGRLKSYIVHMNIAWTKLFHAYYHKENIKYYYKDKSGKYVRIEGEKKAWKLKHCINKYKKFSLGVEENLKFFIGLRNKIEHTYLDCSDLEIKIFGECQALLYNYENFIINHFGQNYAINTSLPFALQFSELRKDNAFKSSKKLLSKEMVKINEYIDKYRSNISDEVFVTQEYSIKLVQIPLVSNVSKSDIAIQFIDWNNLNDIEKESVSKITTLIKNKNIFRDVVNANRLMPRQAMELIKEKVDIYNQNINTALVYIFSIKPSKTLEPNVDPFSTNTKYCFYDQTHGDYQYTEEWVSFAINVLNNSKITIDEIKRLYKERKKIDISEYE